MADVTATDQAGKATITLHGDSGIVSAGGQGRAGAVSLLDNLGKTSVHITSGTQAGQAPPSGPAHPGPSVQAEETPPAPPVSLRVECITLDGDAGSFIIGKIQRHGQIMVLNDKGASSLLLRGRAAEAGGEILVNDAAGNKTILLDGGAAQVGVGGSMHPGLLHLNDSTGEHTIGLHGVDGSINVGALGYDGQVRVYNGEPDGQGGTRVTVHLDGKLGNIYLGDGKGNRTIEINGQLGDVKLLNEDCAEDFDLDGMDVEPGTVMVISTAEKLRESSSAYDKRVAGVISGAGSLRPALTLGHRPAAKGRRAIALSGKVYCKVEADGVPIEVGDLLTTSTVPGHAMRADPARAFGAVLGKALAPLPSGRGLIPVLVALH